MSELPVGWVEAEIKVLCELTNGKAFKPSDWSSEGLPIVRIQNLNNPDAPFNYFKGEVRSRFLIDRNQLLFAWSGTPGTSFGAHIWDGGPAILNQHIFKVNFDEQHLDRVFLKAAINQKLEDLIHKAHGGVGLRHITKGKFEETTITVPPLPEQKRIIAELDSLAAKSDRAREDLKRIETLVGRYKQAVLSEAFSGQLTAKWRQLFPNELPIEPLENGLPDDRESVFELTSNSDIPETWRNCRLGNLGDVLGGGTPSKKEPSYWEGEIPWVTPKDMKVDIINKTIDSISELGLSNSATKSIPEGSVLFVVRGMILAHSFPVAMTQRPVTVNQDMKALVPIKSVSPIFLLWALKRNEEAIVRLAGSATHGTKRLESSVVLNLAVPMAPLKEQNEIVYRIEAAFDKIERLAKDAKRALMLLGKLDESILTRAFRGELVPQDPTDEPAGSVLQRIKKKKVAGTKPTRHGAIVK